jgi:hypothetical protein
MLPEHGHVMPAEIYVAHEPGLILLIPPAHPYVATALPAAAMQIY